VGGYAMVIEIVPQFRDNHGENWPVEHTPKPLVETIRSFVTNLAIKKEEGRKRNFRPFWKQ